MKLKRLLKKDQINKIVLTKVIIRIEYSSLLQSSMRHSHCFQHLHEYYFIYFLLKCSDLCEFIQFISSQINSLFCSDYICTIDNILLSFLCIDNKTIPYLMMVFLVVFCYFCSFCIGAINDGNSQKGAAGFGKLQRVFSSHLSELQSVNYFLFVVFKAFFLDWILWQKYNGAFKRTLKIINENIYKINNFEFGFYLFIFIFLNHNMNLTNEQIDQLVISQLQLITASIESKRIGLNDKNIILWLTISYAFQQRSGEIIKWILNMRNAILKRLPFANNRNQLANAYLSLAITSQILSIGQAEREYKLALSYDQKQPQTNLCLALLLYDQQRHREAFECIGKLRVVTALKQQHRMNIWIILIRKVENRICEQLRKTMNDEKRIAKVQFIRKVMKFKEAFLYHCAEIQSLSQNSYASLAYLLFYTNRFADGLTLTYKLRNLNQPPTQYIQQNLAILFYLLNKFEESAECAKQGLKINPRNQSIHRLLIMSLILLQQIPKAKVCAMGLINLNKYNGQVYQLMGLILSIQGRNALALEYSKLGVVIQPSEQTYLHLAHQFSQNSKFAQAQRCYLKSIKIEPNERNYSELGILYFQNNAHLNAMLCFFESITHNYQRFQSYFYLGLCAKINTFLRSVINMFMDKLKSAHTQDPFLQTCFAVYKFVSNQSHKQMYVFLSNFMEEKKKGGEETLYDDIANQIIQFGLIIQIIKENTIFLLIFGVLCRVKEHRIEANQIFVDLIAHQASINGKSLSAIFTSLYESQISKTPKELQSFFLQFIVAEMVQPSPAQALKCFHKSLSYAQGDYEQFYAEFYKMIERDIEQLWPISIIANSIVDRQPLDEGNSEDVRNAMKKHSFSELGKYTQHLGAMAQIVYALSQQQSSSKLSFQQFHLFLAAVKGNHLIEGLEINVKYPRKVYASLFAQIRNDEETLFKHIQNLCTIYSQKGEIRHLRRKVCEVMELYFDRFILNQKVKLIFNHFHPYIITESCHKQFAVILRRIKECPQYFYYSTWDLMEDLKDMFREGNKHTNKVFQVMKVSQREEVHPQMMKSSIQSEIKGPNSQAKSQRSDIQIFVDQFEDEGESLNGIGRKRSEELGKLFESDETLIEQSPSKRQEKVRKLRVIKKKVVWDSSDQSAEQSQFQGSQLSEINQNSSECTSENGYFQKSYYLRNTQFSSQALYSKFNKLLHLNTFQIIKYLQKQSEAKHVAKHICESSKIGAGGHFRVKVQLADQAYIQNQEKGGKQQSTFQWIRGLGPKFVLRWIADIALGMSELQDLGIYHGDLFFRNTIRVTNKIHQSKFKIIDFDKAFKVRQTDKNDKSFECTKALFDFWLRFRFDGRPTAPTYKYEQSQSSQCSGTLYDPKDIIQYIFVGADQSLVQKLLTIKQESIFSQQKRINKCVKALREHMFVSHRKQYSALAEQLLTDIELQQEFAEQQTFSAVMEKLQLLKKGEIDLIRFAEYVRKTGEINMGEIEE